MSIHNQPSARRLELEQLIKDSPGITRRELVEATGGKVRSIEHLLRRMIIKGIVIRCDPENPGEHSRYYHETGKNLIPFVSVFDHCRRNWTGYYVHKVFGGKGLFRILPQ